jgi:hypothetical protein
MLITMLVHVLPSALCMLCAQLHLADIDADASQAVYPAQWTELSPGNFTYSYKFNSTARKSIYLAVGLARLGETSITNIQNASTMFALLNPPPQQIAGQPLSLQLSMQINNSAASFADFTGNSSGWRVQLLRPDNSSADLGLMADWISGAIGQVPSGVYQWNMTVLGINLTQVGCIAHAMA